MLSRESVDLEQRLAKLLGADPVDVRTYLCEVIEERLWGRRPKERKTGFRFVRGTHGGAFVRDPEGNDTPPVGYEVPRVTEPGLRRGLAHDDVAEGLVRGSQRVRAERDP